MQTEYQGLAEKSGVTVSDLNSLDADNQAIDAILSSGNGSGANPTGTQTAISELAKAIASGGSTAQAQADFNASFNGIPSSLLDKAFDDLVQIIEDSHITTADLSAVASDTAAVQSVSPNTGIGMFFDSNSAASASGGSASANDAQAAANAAATAASTSSSALGTVDVATSQHKHKHEKTRKAAAKERTRTDVHRSKAISRGQAATKRTSVADRLRLDDRSDAE